MPRISAVVITRDEEQIIERCLRSLAWADEIVVVDSASRDRTVERCRQAGAVVFERKEWMGFGPTKKWAVEQASHDWILSVDADEVVSGELAGTIRTRLKEAAGPGYGIRRVSYYLGKRVRHCGWNRDYPVRLFNRQHGAFNEKSVHEAVKLDGKPGIIEAPLFHYTYPTRESHYKKMELYAGLGAAQLKAAGQTSSRLAAGARGGLKFPKMYLLQAGFLDGGTGWKLSTRSAWGVYRKYRKLWELSR